MKTIFKICYVPLSVAPMDETTSDVKEDGQAFTHLHAVADARRCQSGTPSWSNGKQYHQDALGTASVRRHP